MKKNIELVSLQLIRKYQDQKEMWNYIRNEIEDYYSNKKENSGHISMLVLPEYALGNVVRHPSKTIDYVHILEDCKDLTKKFNFNLFSGSAAINENGLWKNRSFITDSNGKTHFYDKQKLFNYEKKLNFSPGSKSLIVTLPVNIRVQILICSDFWFPELIREEINNLPDVVLVPAMSVVPKENLIEYGKWLWYSLAITRSRENVLPVAVADWSIQSFSKSWTCGASCILNPSIKWTTEEELNAAFVTINEKDHGFISTIISLQEVYEYRKYRRETGLLPE
ncbi:MAG: hypothetical protein HeimC3_25730 [Candidatus Heimdallarchaeota archaeon LC_3]|nr:MAG: hypothetical protein HeimC3_25730 [Candidatus Heimdallarchaeota archaeon LC_3]